MHTVIYQNPEFHQYGLWSMLGRGSERTVLRLGKKAVGGRGGALAAEVSKGAGVARSVPVRTADVGAHVPIHSATEGTQMYNPTKLQLRNPTLRPSAETGFQRVGEGTSWSPPKPKRSPSQALAVIPNKFEMRGGGSSWSPPRPTRTPSWALATTGTGAPSRRVSINWKRVGLAGGGAAGLVGGGYLMGRRRRTA